MSEPSYGVVDEQHYALSNFNAEAVIIYYTTSHLKLSTRLQFQYYYYVSNWRGRLLAFLNPFAALEVQIGNARINNRLAGL